MIYFQTWVMLEFLLCAGPNKQLTTNQETYKQANIFVLESANLFLASISSFCFPLFYVMGRDT